MIKSLFIACWTNTTIKVHAATYVWLLNVKASKSEIQIEFFFAISFSTHSYLRLYKIYLCVCVHYIGSLMKIYENFVYLLTLSICVYKERM